MKKLLFVAAASVAALSAMPAAAQDWYAQLNAGYSIAGEADVDLTASDGVTSGSVSESVDLDGGLVLGAAAGVALGNGLRVEGEAFFANNEADAEFDAIDLGSVDTRHNGVYLNVLYDIPMEGSFRPYVGAGIGYGRTSLEFQDEEAHDEGTSWQLKAGVSVPVNETLTVDAGYRYIRAADFSWSGSSEGLTASIDAEPTIHALTVGARLRFSTGS